MPEMPKTITLSEAQAFWLELLLESTLSAANPSRGTRSYAAILKKLVASGYVFDRRAAKR